MAEEFSGSGNPRPDIWPSAATYDYGAISMDLLTGLLVVTQGVILIAGGLLTVLTLRAYRRTGSASLRALAVGFGLLLVGAVLGGTLHQAVAGDLRISFAVQSVCTAAGLSVIAYSLYTGNPPGEPAAFGSDSVDRAGP